MQKYRITVLTSQLLRLEYDEDGFFEDRPTQVVQNRNFPKVDYKVIDEENRLQIITEKLHLIYDKKPFSKNGLSIRLRDRIFKSGSTWHFGEKCEDLGGTARTLDLVDGECKLESGIMSKKGYAYTDDSKSLVINNDGWVEPRKKNTIDVYFWGYGRDYRQCLKDFYHLCGNQPLLPKYALGNWWSRYYKYTQKEYLELMDRFESEGLPFTVAVLDMDWHVVDVDPKYGSGWTGYTWNKKLIPNPEEMLKNLHDRGMHVTLNDHPADGVMPYEELYESVREAVGVEKSEAGIPFDITDPVFTKAYFEKLHHPIEDQGVDFWWIDWQQGDITNIEGLDPLWMLNHYHYHDNKRGGKRPLILSRYAGLGSHRYPLGFSGDTIISWDSLKFQPYFTSTASNVGYGWWSHDIGGHMNGHKDDELAVRWVQYGVFSPINRLHSSDNPFDGKEPWRYNQIAAQIMNKYLNFRHQLIPYLYSMNYLSAVDGEPIIQPMYYLHPWAEEAYEMKNQYYFGNQLMVAPITSQMDNKLQLASVDVWFPDGKWIDIFNGRIYNGGRCMTVYRNQNDIPVFAKAGAILPIYVTGKQGNSLENPETLEVRVYAGADGKFHLYEDLDNGTDTNPKTWADTEFVLDYENGIFDIKPTIGDIKCIPQRRNYKVVFVGFDSVDIDGIETQIFNENNCYVVWLNDIDVACGTTVRFNKKPQILIREYIDEIFEFLNHVQLDFKLKKKIYDCINSNRTVAQIITELYSYKLPDYLYGYLSEILTAQQ